MNRQKPLITTGKLNGQALKDQVIIVTGAGGGIGFEAARSLAWLGAKVVLAEISSSGKAAADKINEELGNQAAWFVKTDVGHEISVGRLARKVLKRYGKADIILNNATVATLGAVTRVNVKAWDSSYRVNLRGPVLMAQKFLPGMIERDTGVFVCVTSEGLEYMGAYETLKAAQLHLSKTIDAELDNTKVISFSIGPGMVPTPTAMKGLEDLARFYGKTVVEMEELTKEHTLPVEAAGAGFAAAVALASNFRGQEVSSRQALIAAGIDFEEALPAQRKLELTQEEMAEALALCIEVRVTLEEQAEGWKNRSVFERQWMIRDFRKNTGRPVEHWLTALADLETILKRDDGLARSDLNLSLLADYYLHMQDLVRGYIKDPVQLEENLRIVGEWHRTAEKLASLIS